MGIGQTGKRAQAISKRQQQRYRPGYQTPDTTPLTLRRHPDATGDSTPLPTVSERPTPRAAIQRTDEAMGSSDQSPADTENSEAQNAASDKVSPKEVAELVYRMMARDAKLDRERRGRRNTRT
jgi:hypothetical protein